MGRRPKTLGFESSAELARKIDILEREMATQRAALDRLKQIGSARMDELESEPSKKTAD